MAVKEVKAYIKNFKGTSYEAGTQMAQWVLAQPELLKKVILPPGSFPEDKLSQIVKLLDEYCSGLNEEIKGFTDTLGISREQVLFYAMTYIERGCSLMAVLPEKVKGGHTLLARNYDFNDEMEEMCFAYTSIRGKYKHISSVLNLFGRCDGMNEHGLAACKASNGLPVGNFDGGQKAGVTGFMFWIVIRSILENCKDVPEAVEWALQAPIAYNINLMLGDSSGRIALFECLNGHKAYKMLDKGSDTQFLSAANHSALDGIKPYEKMIIENSVIRNDRMKALLSQEGKVSKSKIKKLLSTSYPEGLCCHYYEEFFGTLRSMIFDTTDKTIEMTFGSPQANKWHVFSVNPLVEDEIKVMLPLEKADKSFYQMKG